MSKWAKATTVISLPGEVQDKAMQNYICEENASTTHNYPQRLCLAKKKKVKKLVKTYILQSSPTYSLFHDPKNSVANKQNWENLHNEQKKAIRKYHHDGTHSIKAVKTLLVVPNSNM